MTKLLVVALAILALAGALWWFTASAPNARGPRTGASTEESTSSAAVVGASAAQEPAPLASNPPGAAAEDAPSPELAPEASTPSAREAASSRSDELGRAQWVEGRVVLPEGTPADEEPFVVAKGKDFADGRDHRAPVAPDGSFRVAFHEETRMGMLALEARYLYLERVVRWKSAESGTPLVLEPKLGARIAGRLLVPAGTEPSSVGGALELAENRRSGDHSSNRQVGRRELGPKLEFAFEALAPGASTGRSYDLSYDGARFVGELGALLPEAGQTLAVELELRPGVTLAGVVRSAGGHPLPGIHVNAQAHDASGEFSSQGFRATTSAADGTFLLGALEAGEIEVMAVGDGFEPVRRELGKLAAGTALTGLELVLGGGQTIAGIVRWSDGSPAQAEVTLVANASTPDSSHARDELETESRADGGFSFSGLTAEAYRVTASALRKEEVPVTSPLTGRTRTKKQSARWTAELGAVPAGTRDLVLTLTSGLALEGSVSDDLGAPLASFQLSADRIETERISFEELAKSYRDTGGTFRMEGFVPGTWQVTARSKGHAEALERVTLPASEPLRLVLPREAVVRGLVLDPAGVPVAEASLAVDAPRATWSFFGSDERLTDASGRFELDELAPGPTVLRASAPGFAPSASLSLDLVPGGTVEGVQLVLRAGGTIAGEVRGSDGKPAIGQSVWMYAPDFDADAETDAEGRFEVAGVPPGEVQLWTDLEEGIQLQQQVRVAEGETARVLLAAPTQVVRLHGRVLAGGEPLTDADLYANLQQPDETEASRSAQAETDADGAFELNLPGPGRYSIFISQRGDDALQWQTTLEVPAVAALAFDVSIPLGRISGRVTDVHGTPLPRIEVSSEPEQHEDDAHGSAEARTDAEGRYELRVPAGQHAVEAGSARHGWHDESREYARTRVANLVVGPGDHVRGVDLRLAQGGTLAGVVRNADGSPAAEVELWQQDGARFASIGWVDQAGRFELDGLHAGPLRVGASNRTGATGAPMQVEITAGETTRVELTLAPAALVHLSVRQQGAPVGSDITVTDERGVRHPAQPTGKGQAYLGPLVAGRYTVRAQRDGKTVERAFEVTPGAPALALELVFE